MTTVDKYSCRKCRGHLFDGECVLTDQTSTDNGTVWYIDIESAPGWIQDAVQNTHWTKGKLSCPRCKGRVGSFDFVSPTKSAGTAPPIHVLRSRVDSPNTGPMPVPSKPPGTKSASLTTITSSQTSVPSLTSLTPYDGENVIPKTVPIATSHLNTDTNVVSMEISSVDTACEPGQFKAFTIVDRPPGNSTTSDTPLSSAMPVTYCNDLTLSGSSSISGVFKSNSDTENLLEGPYTEKTCKSEKILQGGTTHEGQQDESDWELVDFKQFEVPVTDMNCQKEGNEVGFITDNTGLPADDHLKSISCDLPETLPGTANNHLQCHSSLSRCVLSNENGESCSNKLPNHSTPSTYSSVHASSSHKCDLTAKDISVHETTRQKCDLTEKDISVHETTRQNCDLTAKDISVHESTRQNCDLTGKDNSVHETTRQKCDLTEKDISVGMRTLSIEDENVERAAGCTNDTPTENNNSLTEISCQNKQQRRKGKKHSRRWKLDADNLVYMATNGNNFTDDDAVVHSNQFDILDIEKTKKSDTCTQETLPFYPEEHVCSVCLDLYCSPMTVLPCKHVFCEPCLRRLAKDKPVNTPCPLCRRKITSCLRESDLTRTLKDVYPVHYKQRIHSERKFSTSHFYRLPTQYTLPSQAANSPAPQRTGFASLFEFFGMRNVIMLLVFTLMRFYLECVHGSSDTVKYTLKFLCIAVIGLLTSMLFVSMGYFLMGVFTMLYYVAEFAGTCVVGLCKVVITDVNSEFNYHWNGTQDVEASNANRTIVLLVCSYVVFTVYRRMVRN